MLTVSSNKVIYSVEGKKSTHTLFTGMIIRDNPFDQDRLPWHIIVA